MATSYNRRINLFINVQQVSNDVRSIRTEMVRLEKEHQARMTLGSQEYIAHARRIRKLWGNSRRTQPANCCGFKIMESEQDG